MHRFVSSGSDGDGLGYNHPDHPLVRRLAMPADLLIPAAQYVRMSTEHQQYSLDNQQLAIQAYADKHGFSIVQTYTAGAKSGVVLKLRNGLRQLLQDVMNGNSGYKATCDESKATASPWWSRNRESCRSASSTRCKTIYTKWISARSCSTL